MIMQRKSDGTYEQIGFIKSKDGENIDMIVDAKGDVYFTQGFTREIFGIPPLTLDAIGKNTLDYKIYGNSIQDGTPTPENPIEVQSVGDKTKNLWNGDVEQGAVANTGELKNLNTRIRSKPIKVVGGLEYTISSNLYVRMICCYKDGKFISTIADLTGTMSKKQVSFTVPDGADTLRINFMLNVSGTANVTPDMIEDTMLELGSEATAYEPYGYKIPVVVSAENHEPITTSIYLNEPLRKISDYADVLDFERGVVERKIKKVVFDGSEEFKNQNSIYDSEIKTMLCNTEFIDALEGNYILSSHFTKIYNAQNAQAKPGTFSKNLLEKYKNYTYYNISNKELNVVQSDSTITKVSAFRSYLSKQYDAGTPVTVYYALADPTTEPISIPKIPTFDGTTVISTDTEIQPSNMEITYKGRKENQ